MSFNSFNFNPLIQAALTKQGFETPTAIQEQAIPLVLSGRDVMGLAQTGTGKTAAFVLPILEKLSQRKDRGVRALIIAPTRELAQQIHEVVGNFGKELGLRSMTLFGGVSFGPQAKELKRGVDIIVACPGRLLDHMEQRSIQLSKLEILVLDEADQMFDMGFAPIIRRILKNIPRERQTLMFSATMPQEIRVLAEETLQDYLHVQVTPNLTPTTVSHALYPVDTHLKTKLLIKLLEHTDTESVLVFVRTKYKVKGLATQLEEHGFKTTSLQGNLSQGARKAAMTGFRSGKYQIMVATDIAARGIDISSISHVINFDIPATVEAYTHRIGRTGRAAKTGDALTLVAPEDFLMVRSLERALKMTLERKTLPDFDYGASRTVRTNSQIQTEGRRDQTRSRQQDEGRNRSNSNRGSGNSYSSRGSDSNRGSGNSYSSRGSDSNRGSEKSYSSRGSESNRGSGNSYSSRGSESNRGSENSYSRQRSQNSRPLRGSRPERSGSFANS